MGRWTGRGGFFDLDTRATEVKALEVEISQPEFWQDRSHAVQVQQRHDALVDELRQWRHLRTELGDLHDVAALAEREGTAELRQDVERQLTELHGIFDRLEFAVLLGGPYDERDAIVAIHAGAGGVDAQDWTEMLLRMYLRFAESQGWRTRVVDESRGGEAGIKSVVVEVVGRHAYGYLRAEAGVHRLVRISPFDAEQMRHTSFALVEVLPDLGDVSDVAIRDEELRIDVYRASGHGGQGVNTTDSAVRIVHLPTGITVTCSNERSQHQNKATAMKYLRAKLLQRKIEAQQQEKKKLRGEYKSAEWGSQVRSYVLQPYRLVKDHRTKYEETDVDAVLNGTILGFIEHFLRSAENQQTVSERR